MVWFTVNGGYSRESHKLKGEVEILASNDLRFLGNKLNSLSVQGSRADLQGTGKLARKDGTYSFMICAVDGGWPGRQDRIRIKIWNSAGVLFDTDPGQADATAPSHTLDAGRIVVRQ